jgi:hypothetical protein
MRQVLVEPAQSGGVPAGQHEVHHLSPSPSLPLHSHLRSPRHAGPCPLFKHLVLFKGTVPRDFLRYQQHKRYRWQNLPVSLIPVVHLHLRISPRILEKIRNDPNVIFRGLGEDDS